MENTTGDGNCFFRAVSMYLTGIEDSHEYLRRMVIEHVRYNMDQFLNFSGMPQDEFEIYLQNKTKTRATRNSGESHWADDFIIHATSSFLKTQIVIWTPRRVGRQCAWYTCDGSIVGETAYNNIDIFFDYTSKQIILNNGTGDHFEPADFEND